MKNLLCVFLSVVGLTFVGQAGHLFAADLASGDKTFVMKAAQGGMTEVQLGQLAADKGMSQDVKISAQKW